MAPNRHDAAPFDACQRGARLQRALVVPRPEEIARDWRVLPFTAGRAGWESGQRRGKRAVRVR